MSKLNRSETVTVRFDPRLNYLCELAGRAQRRTKSSFIEWAVQQAIKELGIQTDGWQPIETAPKDGTVILAWSVGQSEDSETQLIFWYDDPDYPDEPPYWCVNYEGHSNLVPTHWMPLPGAPA